ncbi:MAG: phosphoserine phosphatase SerB [Dermatophilus congolensis]|nr:phosphoserine phosphatase SerB [Dermatophilus congolensis]
MTDSTLLAIISGPDAPGQTSAIFSAIAGTRAEVVDLEQVVVRGHLTLGVLFGSRPEDDGELIDRVAGACARKGLTVTFAETPGEHLVKAPGRAIVTALGSPLTTQHVAAVATSIAAYGANIDKIRRLSRYPLTTVEFAVSGVDLPGLQIVLASAAVEYGFDVALSPAGLARHGRRLVVMDVDSTLIQDEVIELLAAHAGREAEVAAVTEAAMRGELDFAESLHHRVATLKGLPASVFDEVRARIRLTPGARTLVRTLKRLGFTVAVVSGGFIEIVGPLAQELGIDHAHANRLEVVDGVLTGRVIGEVVDRAGKARSLRRFAQAEGLPLSRTVAIGDGANDLDMLATAGLGIAFNAKPAVRAQAQTALNQPYLDSVLYLLGITREEIEEADAEAAEKSVSPL